MDIEFMPNTQCNFKCEYCSNQADDDFPFGVSSKTITNIFKLLREKNHKSNVMLIIGGEPSMSKDILKTLKFIVRLRSLFHINLRIDFQTNLSLKKSIYKDISEYVDYFHVGYHYKELKKHNRMNSFLNNLEFVYSIGKLSNLDIMLEDADDDFYSFTLEHVYPYAKLCNNSEMIYSYYGYDSEKTKRHKEFYEKYSVTKNHYEYCGVSYTTNEFYERYANKNPFKNKYCEVGLNSLVVFGNGNVFRCCGEVYEYFKKNGKPFTNINKDYKSAIVGCTHCLLEYCTADLEPVRKDQPFTNDYENCYRKGDVY